MSLFTFPLMWIPLVLVMSLVLLAFAVAVGTALDWLSRYPEDSTAVRRRPEKACSPSAGAIIGGSSRRRA